MEIKTKVEVGLGFHDLPGLIPRFVEIEACNAANYRFFHDWPELTSDQKAELVAHHFASGMIEGHKNDAITKQMKKKKGKGGL